MGENLNSDLTHSEISTDLVKTLFEVGYVAVGRGLQSYAEDIFNALAAARPESELPIVGLAVCKMNFGAFTVAATLLAERALKINPSSDIAKSFLGMILYLCGAKDKALAVMKDVLDNGTDASALSIARNIIDEINSK
jgi:Flp pilus assembly protein TadD